MAGIRVSARLGLPSHTVDTALFEMSLGSLSAHEGLADPVVGDYAFYSPDGIGGGLKIRVNFNRGTNMRRDEISSRFSVDDTVVNRCLHRVDRRCVVHRETGG